MRQVAFVLALVAVLCAIPCWAQGDAALTAARRLFTEAVGDEDAKRYETALAKFREVAAVKDTANVRYRIATCLDALARDAEALDSYDAAIRLGAQDPAGSDVVRAARARRTARAHSGLALHRPVTRSARGHRGARG